MIRLTRGGWLAAGIGTAVGATGRALGVIELTLLGLGTVALVAAALALVVLTRLDVGMGRAAQPLRVHAGEPSQARATVHNRGRRATPVLTLHDPVGDADVALRMAPIVAGGRASTTYDLPTRRRGIVPLGPLGLEMTDPFGLARARVRGGGRASLTVYPRVDRIEPLPPAAGSDLHGETDQAHRLSPAGDEFYALRPYVVGDDLRRVHWSSTAHADTLMVRQDEQPRQGRVTVALDLRSGTRWPAALELVVSAAASVVRASRSVHDLVRVVSSDGTDTGYAADPRHTAAVMEHLARVGPSPEGTVRPLLGRLGRTTGGGALVVVGAADDDGAGLSSREIAALQRLRPRFGRVVVVAFHPSAWDRRVRPAAVSLPGVALVTRDRPFPAAWHQVVRPRLAPPRAG